MSLEKIPVFNALKNQDCKTRFIHKKEVVAFLVLSQWK